MKAQISPLALLLILACGSSNEEAAEATTRPVIGGVVPVAGTPDEVPHEDKPHVNQAPGWGQQDAPVPDDAYADAHQEVPHRTMPPGAGPDGLAQAPPKPPPDEPIPEDGEIPEVPPLVLQEGDTLRITGSAPGVSQGQVRFTEKRGDDWVVVEVNVIVDGRFEVVAPANVPYPVYVSVGSDLKADGPSEDDLRGALTEPISIGAEDIELSVPVGEVPGWAQAQDPPIHQILDREAVLHAAKDR